MKRRDEDCGQKGAGDAAARKKKAVTTMKGYLGAATPVIVPLEVQEEGISAPFWKSGVLYDDRYDKPKDGSSHN